MLAAKGLAGKLQFNQQARIIVFRLPGFKKVLLKNNYQLERKSAIGSIKGLNCYKLSLKDPKLGLYLETFTWIGVYKKKSIHAL